jgi:hypothetical protein
MAGSGIVFDFDFYESEYQQFQWDIHILIEGTLDASVEYLGTRVKSDLAQIEGALDKAYDDDHHQYLIDEHVDVVETISSQERFLRNMALVALASRLTHALHDMARSAESFSSRKKRYGDSKKGEFAQLWAEYQERFGIDLEGEHKERIAFVETMRVVRNQIVHNGGEANKYKFMDEINMDNGDAGFTDMSFSEKYPAYVSGSGIGAEVSVSKEQLQSMIEASVNLIGWLSKDLRSRELLSIKKGTGIQ